MKSKLKNKTILIFLTLLLTVFSFYQCDELFNNSGDDNTIAEGSYISTNPSDPEFIKLITNNGEVINVFGERDLNGYPKKVTQINIEAENGEKSSFFYDNNNRIKTVIADNGTVFNYDWIDNENAALTIDCNDGINQINTDISLADLDIEKSIKINSNAIMRDPGNQCYDMEFIPFSEEEQVKDDIQTKSVSAYGTKFDLYTTSCGAPTNQQPYTVYIYDQSGSVLLKELSAQYVSKGHYSISVPTGTAPSIDPQSMVEKLTSILTIYCDAAGLSGALFTPAACAYLSAKLALTGIGATAAPAVGTACATVTSALAIYCNTVGASAAPGMPSLMDKFNDQKFLDNFKLTGDMRMHVKFHGLPNSITKAFTISEGVSKTLNAELSENAKPSIRSLTLTPASPSASQDYVIKASVFCAPVGSTVTISMVGTDGYTQSNDFVINNAQESAGTFTMSIPGADEGVKDEITVTIRTTEGVTITRTASLIFGK